MAETVLFILWSPVTCLAMHHLQLTGLNRDEGSKEVGEGGGLDTRISWKPSPLGILFGPRQADPFFSAQAQRSVQITPLDIPTLARLFRSPLVPRGRVIAAEEKGAGGATLSLKRLHVIC